MALYLVVHTPRKDDEETLYPATRMTEMARDHGQEGERTRWLTAWSPDLHDERHFTLWSAHSAEDVREVMKRYDFLSEMDSEPVCVQQWTPSDVLEAGKIED